LCFNRVKTLLDKSLQDWSAANGGLEPDLSRHNVSGKPAFGWSTAAELKAAWGKGVPLIQPEVIGNGRGGEANLVVDLRTGFNGRPRMPRGGPYLSIAEIDEIVAWIDVGCPA